MIFIDQEKTRGRLTAPERQEFAEEAQELGIQTHEQISEGQALDLVLQKLSKQSLSNALIVNSIRKTIVR